MVDRIVVQSPDCRERVAFDLAQRIADSEESPNRENARAYWLKLYYQCWRTILGEDPQGS